MSRMQYVVAVLICLFAALCSLVLATVGGLLTVVGSVLAVLFIVAGGLTVADFPFRRKEDA